MTYPSIPLQPSRDVARRHAQAINHLLNRRGYIHITNVDLTAGVSIVLTQFPVPLTMDVDESMFTATAAATASAVFHVKVGGVSVGSITFGAGQTSGTMTLTSADIPRQTDFEITAPNPADATLAGVTLSLAVSR